MKNIEKLYSTLVSLVLFSTPALVVFAVAKDFKDLITNTIIGGILRPLVPLLIGLAVVIFIYGVLTTMLAEGGEKKEDGKKYMLWGIVGIFVMVSVWGLVAILTSTLNLDTTQIKTINITVPPGL